MELKFERIAGKSKPFYLLTCGLVGLVAAGRSLGERTAAA